MTKREIFRIVRFLTKIRFLIDLLGLDVLEVVRAHSDRVLVAPDGAEVDVSRSSVQRFAPGGASF